MSDQRKRLPVESWRTTSETRIWPGRRWCRRGGELNGSAEKVALLGDGFAGVEADAHAERRGRMLDGVGVAAALDGDRALDSAGGRVERRHDAVARVLDLGAAVALRASRTMLLCARTSC